ncbi:unnamed protein product [Ceutorhynchus assimilis]|uniref:THAP-type domain-containing protein n=1 Tax=Ceutorhynchus assimilis TaxID=467358 RepID=A0A9N9QI32_9CUCU|nr:unnamed protein product [Ceutorhynchus assimilis]
MPRPRRSDLSQRSRNAIRLRNATNNTTEEEKEIARERCRLRMARLRASQTEEQREARRQTERLALRNRRASQTACVALKSVGEIGTDTRDFTIRSLHFKYEKQSTKSYSRNYKKKTSEIIRFPKNPERRKIWFSIFGMEDNENFPKYAEICSDHFHPSDIVTKPYGNRYLRADADPDLNAPFFPDPSCSSSRSTASVSPPSPWSPPRSSG